MTFHTEINSWEVVDTTKAWFFHLATLLLCVYPLGLIIYMIKAGKSQEKRSAARLPLTKVPVPMKPSTKTSTWDFSALLSSVQWTSRRKAAGAAAVCFTLFSASSLTFATGGVGFQDHSPGKFPGASHLEVLAEHGKAGAAAAGEISTSSMASAAMAGVACLAVAVGAAARRRIKGVAGSLRGGRVARQQQTETPFHGQEAPKDLVPIYSTPIATPGLSLWHNVKLHVIDQAGQDDGIYRYINEIPAGCLQKFEMHTDQPWSAISEHEKGSRKLREFGVPVPFNYGCFPQTYRDPDVLDELFQAGGDDDPLDVVDLSSAPVEVGAVVRCRPLGAVCLIDEGQADWKVLVVNVDHAGPLREARSIDDVERIVPGKVNEVLKWMDDFKRNSTVDSEMHFEVHDSLRAVSIIEGDHASYRQLVDNAPPSGISRGHWIRPPVQPKVLGTPLGWVHRHGVGGSLAEQAPMVGAAWPCGLVREQPQTVTVRRQVWPACARRMD